MTAAFIHDRVRRELAQYGFPTDGLSDWEIDRFASAYQAGATPETVLGMIHDDLRGGHDEARSTSHDLPALPDEGPGEDGAGETEDGGERREGDGGCLDGGLVDPGDGVVAEAEGDGGEVR